MALIVQKYGGTSVADPDRMRAVAENVQITKRHGNDVVVVVSAMGKATDNLIALAGQVSATRPGREMDMLLTTGERVSAALLTMALADLGVAAVSFTGSQVGIITDTIHGKAKIVEVKGDRVRDALAAGKVAVVAGFQGVSTDKEITTMGRGRVGPHRVGAGQGARRRRLRDLHRRHRRVLRRPAHRAAGPQARTGSASTRCSRWPAPAPRCWPCARSSSPATTASPLHVRSAFTWEPGTWVTDEPDDDDNPREGAMEDPIISGVVTDTSESKVTVLGVPDRPGISAALFEPLAAANVNVDMIVQNTSTEGTTDISFTVPSADMGVAEDIVSRVAEEIGAAGVTHDSDIAKVSRRRRRHEDVARHRRQDVPHARRRGRQHRDDLDVDDPHLGRHRRRRPRAGGPRACTPRSASTAAPTTPRRSPSVAEPTRSLHSAPTVRDARGRGSSVKTYVVGIDGSETAARGRGARRRAGRRHRRHRSTSCAPSPSGDAHDDQRRLATRSSCRSLTTAEQIAEQQAATFRTQGIEATSAAVDEQAGRRRCSPRPTRLEAEVIVVGNRRMQGVGRLLGSVANEVAHNAPCDVLIVKTV